MENNSKLVEEYLKKARITDELLPNSVIKYRESIKRFFIGIGEKSFAALEMRDFDDYTYKAKIKGNDNSGIRSVIYAVKWIMKRLQDDSVIDKRVDLEKINMPKIKRREVIYLTKEEIAKFLGVIEEELSKGEATRKIRTMTLYTLLLETGARISEALSIKIKDIDFENGEIPIVGKGNKPRTLFLHNKSTQWIRKYLEKRKDDNEYLFVNRAGDSKWSYNDACRSFQGYKRRSGINKDFSIHTFRHTFATQLLFNGVRINEVSFLLGHEDIQTTIKYYIGTVNKAEIKKSVLDRHFDFIPKAVLENINSS